MKKLSLRNLQKMIDEKYISVQTHPTLPLKIYNYTPHAQFDALWNNETLSCRGLIMDDKFNIVARPFQKFFNLEELTGQGKQLPLEDFEVTEKMDGSLGIMYWDNDTPYLATRGSFTSTQAFEGTRILREKNKTIPLFKGYTYLFEIIYPGNRIVVDYGTTEDIVLLAMIDTVSGKELSYFEMTNLVGHQAWTAVKRYDGVTDYRTLASSPRENSEGYVIRFKDGTRVKVKFTEYKRLHKLLTGINARRIWEALQAGDTVEDMCHQVPDEFYDWVQKAAQRIKKSYRDIELASLNAVAETEDQNFTGDTRELKKQKVQYAMSHFPKMYWGLIFMILDGKDYRSEIWKMIRPAHQKPFNQQLSVEGE